MAINSILVQGLIELHLKGEGGQQAVASMTKILQQAKEVEKAVGGIEPAAKKTTDSIIEMGKAIYGYFATSALTQFLKDSYVGFARTERQALAVENQIKALGQAGQGSGFRQFIETLSTTSGILDDDLVPAFQRALLAFRDYATAQEVVTKAAQFAANGIGDVQSNVEKLSRFFQTGSPRSLVEFGLNVKDTADSVLSLTDGFKLLDEQLSRQSSGFDDAQKRIDVMGIAVDRLRDSLGKLVDLAVTSAIFGGHVGHAPPAVPGVPFGPQPESPLQRAAREEQARREVDGAKKIAADKLKIEQDHLQDVKEANEQNAQELIRAVLEQYKAGTDERLNLELALNERIRAAAVANAQQIGADTGVVNDIFNERAKAIRANFDEAVAAEISAADQRRDALIKVAEEQAEDRIRIAEEEAARIREIEDRKTQWYVDSAKMQTDTIIEAGSRTGNALAGIFNKRKGFAIGMAIMDTASAIMQIWADSSGGPWYVKLAKTIAMAAEGALRISQIRSATMSGGGGISGGGGGVPQNAAPPTQPAAPIRTENNDAIIGSAASMSMAPNSIRQAMNGSGGSLVINIRNAFGDRAAISKLTREIQRELSNQQSVLR